MIKAKWSVGVSPHSSIVFYWQKTLNSSVSLQFGLCKSQPDTINIADKIGRVKDFRNSWKLPPFPPQSVPPVLCLVAQSCPTFCDLVDCSPPGSSAHGILQARMLEWVAMPSSTGSCQPRNWTQVSCIAGGPFTVWATREAHECRSGSPIPRPGIGPRSPALQADSLPAELPGKP